MKYVIRRDPNGIINITNPQGRVFAQVTRWKDAWAIARAIHARNTK